MADNARQLARRAAHYYPYVEPKPGEARKLFRALADRSCVIVTDDYPIALPAVQSVDHKAKSRIEAIDGNGVLPLRAAAKAYSTARAFRRFVQTVALEYLFDTPQPDPLAGRKLPRLNSLPDDIARRWPAVEAKLLSSGFDLARLPINHRVGTVSPEGGSRAARKVWQQFLRGKLSRYADDRNQPEADASSGLSAYLHFGHISADQIVHDLLAAEMWTPDRLPEKPNGKNEGWWNMSPDAEAFLDQIITWRELGFNVCHWLPNYDDYDSLPDWAKATLAKHARDKRREIYARSVRRGRHARPALERGAAAIACGRPHPQLLADGLGQESA